MAGCVMQTFNHVTPECHPAAPALFRVLEAQARKDIEMFAACFDERLPLFMNLAGGFQIHSVAEIIERHRAFYASPDFCFTYREPRDGIGNESFFACSVPVRVAFPNGSIKNAFIDITLIEHEGHWAPVRFINTVVDSSQVVLHD